MKVELDLSTEQLENLDNDLTNVLENLTEEQKIEILKSYINNKFDKMERTYKDRWNDEHTELTDFGVKLVRGLQDKISDTVTTKILEDNEVAKKLIQEQCDTIINNLEEIIRQSISSYVIEHLFSDKGYVQDKVNRQIIDTIYSMKRRGEL